MLFLAYLALYAFVFLLGSCLGSFLNVVIYRVPRQISVARGRSFCPACHHRLSAADLVPVLSFSLLKGRCRYCRTPISLRYPLVEALTGAAAVVVFARFSLSTAAVVMFCAACVLIAVAFIDADTMTIPNGLVLALAVPAAAAAVVLPETGLLSRGLGAVGFALPFFLITLAVPDAFGGGDIKLMAIGGFLLGWKASIVAAFLAILSAGLYGMVLMARNRGNRRRHFAFGPFLCAGIFVASLWGDQVLIWYMDIFGL